MPEALHRLFRRREGGQPTLRQAAAVHGARRLPHRAHHQGHAGPRRGEERRHPGGVGQAGRGQHGQDAAHLPRAGQQGGRLRQAGRRLDPDIDDGRRIAAGEGQAQHLPRFRRQSRQADAAPQRRVRRHAARPDGVGDHHQAAVPGRGRPGQRFQRGQQVFQPGHGQHAGPGERGVEHHLRPAGRVQQAAAGAQRHHRPQAGGGAGGGQEGAGVADAPDVQQDRAGGGIARQEVQHLVEPGAGIAADADDLAEPDAVRPGPVQHRPAECGGLRHQRHPAGARLQVRQGGVQAERGTGHAERPGAEHAHARLPLRRREVGAEPHRHPGIDAGADQAGQQGRHRRSLHREDRQVSRVGLLPGGEGLHCPGEAASRHIVQHLPPDTAVAAEHRQRTRPEHALRIEAGCRKGAGCDHAAMQHSATEWRGIASRTPS